jgi:hypothetical protein
MTSQSQIKTQAKTQEDFLLEDDQIAGQQFYCISFLSPEGIKNCSMRGIKMRGVYATVEEAKARCEYLKSVDPKMHVFVGDVGKWLPWDPNPNTCKDQVYQEKELNDLMKGYNDNYDMAKKMHDQRRGDKQKEVAYNELDKTNKIKYRLQEQLKKNNLDKKLETIISDSVSNKSINKENKEEANQEATHVTFKDREKLLLDQSMSISNKKNEVSSITNKLSNIQEMYNKLQEKTKVVTASNNASSSS